jgi:hypothetical protein
MITKMMTLVSIALLLAAVFWRPSTGYEVGLHVMVFVTALVVMVQAYRMDKVRWSFAFALIAALFNPITSPQFSVAVFLLLEAISIGLFAVSLYVLRTQSLAVDQ